MITRLTETWKAEQRAFADRDLSGVDYVYLWADGIHVNIRLEEHKLCLLVHDRRPRRRPQGTRRAGRRLPRVDRVLGRPAARLRTARDARPGPRVGDGALGFWGALREVFPTTREQRCWFHKIANVLGALPKSAHPGAKKALAEIWNAEDRDHARDAVTAFKPAYGAKFGKAVAKITDDLDELLAFYDYPAEHWIHLRTTNPIESTFATVRHRTKITNGPGSRAAGLAMAFKLIEAAQDRWRAVNAPHLVALVRAGATFDQRQARRTTRRTTINPKPPKRSSSTGLDDCSPRNLEQTVTTFRRRRRRAPDLLQYPCTTAAQTITTDRHCPRRIPVELRKHADTAPTCKSGAEGIRTPDPLMSMKERGLRSS